MRVLIVEDMSEKADDLVRFMTAEFAAEDIQIARSFQSGLRAALSANADLMLLDMTMTNYDRSVQEDGGRPHPFAGKEILRQLQREAVHLPSIVVTNFDRFGEEAEEVTLQQLKTELEARFPDYLGTVHYRSNVDEWKKQLRDLIKLFVLKE
jgi:CheY-like chemotaxis protein